MIEVTTMNELTLAGLLMIPVAISCVMIWSQSREQHGKPSVSDSVINWVAKHIA